MKTLLAHLGARFTNSEENLATESLHFLLVTSTVAREAFQQFVSRVVGHDTRIASFITQAASGEGTIPDIACRDEQGQEVILVESKFWAGLTDAQPVEYVKRLQEDKGELLLFVAPEKRQDTLWAELVRRCVDAKQVGRNTTPTKTLFTKSLALGNSIKIAITSWNALLKEIIQSTSAAGETLTTENANQLLGLCLRADETGFLPFKSEEVGVNFALRLGQLCSLVNDLVGNLVEKGMASVRGYRPVGGANFYHQYMSFKGNGAGLWLSSDWWSSRRETPMWLALKGPDWKPSNAIRTAMASLIASSEPEAFVDDDGTILIPLFIPLGVEKDVVVADLLTQLRKIYDLVPGAEREATPPPEQV